MAAVAGEFRPVRLDSPEADLDLKISFLFYAACSVSAVVQLIKPKLRPALIVGTFDRAAGIESRQKLSMFN
jgi:hypothetical protein